MIRARALLLLSAVVAAMLITGTTTARGLDDNDGSDGSGGGGGGGGVGVLPTELPGDGLTGPAHSYTDHGDGTATDNLTGLMWELKDSGNGIHGVNRAFAISAEDFLPPITTARGPAFTVFLWTLNNTCSGDEQKVCAGNAQCAGIGNGLCGFAGYRDWRLPNVVELATLLDFRRRQLPISLPGVVTTEPNFLTGAEYWTLTPYGLTDTEEFYTIHFGGSFNLVASRDAAVPTRVRAVRGGRNEPACVWVTIPRLSSVCPCGHGACGPDPLCAQYSRFEELYCPQ